MGRLACCVWDTCTHLWQKMFISLCILGQKKQSPISFNGLSVPNWPILLIQLISNFWKHRLPFGLILPMRGPSVQITLSLPNLCDYSLRTLTYEFMCSRSLISHSVVKYVAGHRVLLFCLHLIFEKWLNCGEHILCFCVFLECIKWEWSQEWRLFVALLLWLCWLTHNRSFKIYWHSW